MARTKKTLAAKVVKGSHLTVITHADGRTELEWDDAALLRDVQAAISSVNNPAPIKTKSTRKKNQ